MMEGFVAHLRRLAMLVLIALSALSAPAAAQTCDRACLTGMITTYVDALVARDHSKLPLAAPDIKYTEDSKAAKLGEGVWKLALTKTTFRHDYIDAKKQVAAAHVALMEGQNHILYSLVLYVKDRKIAGIETLMQRITPGSRWQPKELGQPVRGMNDPVPAGKKMSRADMIRTALTYTEGLRIGSFTDGKTPFADGMYRVENGVVTAGPGCGRPECGLYEQNIMLHPSIVASVAAVDEEAGTVLLWMNFGYTDSYGPGSSLVTFEAFKVWGGQIHAINAFFPTLPLATARFWPSLDPLPKP
jgi:hypothetical protein